MMPTHIRAGGVPMTKLTLAKQALLRLKLEVSDDGKLLMRSRSKTLRLYDHDAVIKQLENNGQINITAIAFKQRKAMSLYMLRRDWERTSTPWVYKRSDNVNRHANLR